MNNFVLTQEEDKERKIGRDKERKERKLQIERLSVQYVLMDQFDRPDGIPACFVCLSVFPLAFSSQFNHLAEHRPPSRFTEEVAKQGVESVCVCVCVCGGGGVERVDGLFGLETGRINPVVSGLRTFGPTVFLAQQIQPALT